MLKQLYENSLNYEIIFGVRSAIDRKRIIKKLDLLDTNKLNFLSSEILFLTINAFRSMSKITDKSNMQQGIIWHLADATHNLPRSFNNREELLSAIPEFVSVMKTFSNYMNDKEISYFNLLSLLELAEKIELL
jgi:hypothetical protein